MEEILWTILGWILKAACVLGAISGIGYLIYFIWLMATNGGRKWYYYDPGRPWKGGYWEPLLPSTPPYNEYKWNPKTARFEHKVTGEPLQPWEKTLDEKRAEIYSQSDKYESDKYEYDWDALGYPEYLQKPSSVKPSKPVKARPEWVRFLFEENIGTLMERRKRRKWAKQQEKEKELL